jgi:hypothetical protein
MTDLETNAPEQETVADSRLHEASNASGTESTQDDDPVEIYDDTDYIPDFIQEMIDDPPIFPGESKDGFVGLFESFEFGYRQRPKTDLEYLWTFQAAVAAWETMRYERIKAAIVASERRMAVETLHRQISSETITNKEFIAMRNSARENTRLFFADPIYRKKFAEQLELAGFGARAIDAAAFGRAITSLATIDRLIKSAEKRLADCLKKLDLAYSTRDPEDEMPRSLAAKRASDLVHEKAEELRKARGYDQRKATGSEQA